LFVFRNYFLHIRNQVTPPDTLIYLIVKIVVILSEPVEMEVILRKRIAVSIAKTEGWWTGKTFRNLLGYVRILRSIRLKYFVLFHRKHIKEQVFFMNLSQLFQKLFMQLKIKIKQIPNVFHKI
jgi:hypothetical protein